MLQAPPAPAPETIKLRIATARGQKVILDADLAALYGVPTKRFNEAVKRNEAKFPPDFMFVLSAEEFSTLRSQMATSNNGATGPAVGRGGRRHAPHVFTEHGALMAAAILNTPQADEVSVHVVRAFVRLRELAVSHADLSKRLDELEERTASLSLQQDAFSRDTHHQLKQVFEALRALATPTAAPKRPIGFVITEDEV